MDQVRVATPILQGDPMAAAQSRLERTMTGPARFPELGALAYPFLAAAALADGAVQNQRFLRDLLLPDPWRRQIHRCRTERVVVPWPELPEEASQPTGGLRPLLHPKTAQQGL
jgi:hypothetical protein